MTTKSPIASTSSNLTPEPLKTAAGDGVELAVPLDVFAVAFALEPEGCAFPTVLVLVELVPESAATTPKYAGFLVTVSSKISAAPEPLKVDGTQENYLLLA